MSNCILESVQIDPIDMWHEPDGQFKWIRHIVDHFSEVTSLAAWKSKCAIEVANSIAISIGQFEPPAILQWEYGREFRGVLSILFKSVGVQDINDTPRTHSTERLVEQANGTAKTQLPAWKDDCIQKIRLLLYPISYLNWIGQSTEEPENPPTWLSLVVSAAGIATCYLQNKKVLLWIMFLMQLLMNYLFLIRVLPLMSHTPLQHHISSISIMHHQLCYWAYSQPIQLRPVLPAHLQTLLYNLQPLPKEIEIKISTMGHLLPPQHLVSLHLLSHHQLSSLILKKKFNKIWLKHEPRWYKSIPIDIHWKDSNQGIL